jgi:hypothetical protein
VCALLVWPERGGFFIAARGARAPDRTAQGASLSPRRRSGRSQPSNGEERAAAGVGFGWPVGGDLDFEIFQVGGAARRARVEGRICPQNVFVK